MQNNGEARIPVMLGFFRQGVSRYGDGLQRLDIPQFPEQIASVAVPKVDIANGEIQPFSFCHTQRRLIPLGNMDDITILAEQLCRSLKRGEVIFHQ